METSGNITTDLPVVLGIDGGATHSWAVAVDARGRLLGTGHAGCLNFFGSGLAEARRNLKDLVRTLSAEMTPDLEFSSIVIGCAALFEEATPAEKEALCRDILPLARTRVVGDSMTAYLGATLGQPGLLIISGTGSIILARNEAEQFRQVGGWGHILGDAGSAYWIALEAVKAAIASAEGTGPGTNLGPLICRWFQVRELAEIIPIVHSPIFTKERFAALARHLEERAEADDPGYQNICRRAGRELAAQAVAAVQAVGLESRPVPVYLVGGVLTNDALVRSELLAALQETFPVELRPPHLPPVLGAAAMALSDSGITLSPELAGSLAKSFDQTASTQQGMK